MKNTIICNFLAVYLHIFFTYMSSLRYFGVYIQALVVIFWRDIFKFIGLFGMVLVGYSGTLYFSLRYDADVANSTTANLLSGEGRCIYVIVSVYNEVTDHQINGMGACPYTNLSQNSLLEV